jgi:hypothetical protein
LDAGSGRTQFCCGRFRACEHVFQVPHAIPSLGQFRGTGFGLGQPGFEGPSAAERGRQIALQILDAAAGLGQFRGASIGVLQPVFQFPNPGLGCG